MSQELFKLERGNPDNLEGLAVVYGKVVPPHCEGCTYTGLYVSSNVTRLFKPEEKEALTEALRQIPIVASMMSEVPTSQEGPWGRVHHAQRPLQERELEQIMGYEGDVINTGTFKTAGLAGLVYSSVSSAYLAKYADQWHARMDPEKTITTTRSAEDLTLLAPEQLLPRLYMVSGELIQGYDGEEKSRISQAQNTLVTFASKTGLQKEVEQIITSARNREDPHRLTRVQKQVELVNALRTEKYEQAAHLRDELKALKDKSKQPSPHTR